MSQTESAAVPDGAKISRTTEAFVDGALRVQEAELETSWPGAPASHLRVFQARAALAASNARHDWALCCALVSALAVVGGVVIVRADPTRNGTLWAWGLIVALTFGIVVYRLVVIRRTQRSEDRAARWLAARGLP